MVAARRAIDLRARVAVRDALIAFFDAHPKGCRVSLHSEQPAEMD
jgi:hypothetical protein